MPLDQSAWYVVDARPAADGVGEGDSTAAGVADAAGWACCAATGLGPTQVMLTLGTGIGTGGRHTPAAAVSIAAVADSSAANAVTPAAQFTFRRAPAVSVVLVSLVTLLLSSSMSMPASAPLHQRSTAVAAEVRRRRVHRAAAPTPRGQHQKHVEETTFTSPRLVADASQEVNAG